MRIPTLHGLIDRRLLVNFRVDADALAAFLPPPFEPETVGGYGVAGICLIRLKQIRPRGVPGWAGIGSENAAHRIAVTWTDDQGERRRGVYIPRRDTDSRLNACAGGRLFPGECHHARFDVHETADSLSIALASDDGRTFVEVQGEVAEELDGQSVFGSLEQASAFFEGGSLGYSATTQPGRYDGLELRCERWQVQPLAVGRVRSSFFEDRELFSADAAAFDSALLMRGIEHQWIGRPMLCCEPAVA